MSGKTRTPTVGVINAAENFCTWLDCMMYSKKISQYKLAEICGCDRKTIMEILNRRRFPKFDIMVRCYEYFGYKAVNIPFDKQLFEGWATGRPEVSDGTL